MLRAFATFNPHANFSLAGDANLSASNPSWKKWRPDRQTCPHWYSPESLRNLIAPLWQKTDRWQGQDRTGVCSRVWRAEQHGQDQIGARRRWLSGAGLSDLVIGEDVDLKRVAALLQSMKAAARPVKSAALGILGEQHLAHCLVRIKVQTRTVFATSVSCCPKERMAPFVLEVAFGVKEASRGHERREVVVGLNWSAALQPPFDELPRLLGEMRIDEHDPVTLVVHLACPKLGYTDRGKARLALMPDVQEALRHAFTWWRNLGKRRNARSTAKIG